MSSATAIRMCYCGVAHAEGITCDQVMVPTDVASIRLTFGEHLSVWFRNLPGWPTALAVWYLSRQLRRDKAFRDAWHANIAMPIYDATRPQCLCSVYQCPATVNCKYSSPTEDHCAIHCPEARYGSEWLREMPAGQCNAIANKLMEHLFGA